MERAALVTEHWLHRVRGGAEVLTTVRAPGYGCTSSVVNQRPMPLPPYRNPTRMLRRRLG